MEQAPESKPSSHSKKALSGPRSQQQMNRQFIPPPHQQQPQQAYPQTPQMNQQMNQSRQQPQMFSQQQSQTNQQTQQQRAVNIKTYNDQFIGCSCRVAANVFAIVVLVISAIHAGLDVYAISDSYGILGYYFDLALVLVQMVGSVMVILAHFNDSSCLYISGEVIGVLSLVHYGAIFVIGSWLTVANGFSLLISGVILVPTIMITLLIMLIIASARCVKVVNAEKLGLRNIGSGVPLGYVSAQMYQQQSLANQQSVSSIT